MAEGTLQTRFIIYDQGRRRFQGAWRFFFPFSFQVSHQVKFKIIGLNALVRRQRLFCSVERLHQVRRYNNNQFRTIFLIGRASEEGSQNGDVSQQGKLRDVFPEVFPEQSSNGKMSKFRNDFPATLLVGAC